MTARKISIYAQPQIRLPLTAEEIALLIRLSECHYDGKCKEAGRHGGFIYGWSNRAAYWAIAPTDNDQTVHATWNNIDLTLKILEIRHMAKTSGIITETEATLLRDLQSFLYDVLRQVTAATKGWSWSGDVGGLRGKSASQMILDDPFGPPQS